MAKEAIGTWELIANGHKGTLTIPNIDAAGRLSGAKAFGNNIIGFWDEDAKKITFLRATKSGDASGDQVFTGYYFASGPEEQFALVNYLTGSFEAFEGTGGSANRVLYGWFAKQGVKPPA
jgi:hypothetical protein